MKLFGQTYNIVIHIRGSVDRTEKFRKFTERMISIDNRTR
jgi:hypothetical protein